MHSYGDIADALHARANTSKVSETPSTGRRPIDAVLRNARLTEGRLTGQIFADWRERFKDGTLVVTSPGVAQYRDVVYTANTVYFVAEWANE